MKKKFFSLIAFTVAFFQSTGAGAQVNHQAALDEIAGTILKSYAADSRELIYLHTDKPYYVAGNTLWFRAYLLNQQNHQPSNVSNKVYVELVNDKDTVVQMLLLNAREHELNGGMKLPVNLTEGYYQLRAYTDHIIKSSPANIFRTSVYIVKWIANSSTAQKIPIYPKSPSSNELDIRFYPEGGNLINGINSTVAFRAFDAKGNPMKITGTVRDDRKTAVTGFQTSPDGLGKLEFFPSKNRTYTAYARLPDNSEKTYPLPSIDNYAWQLSLLKQEQNSLRLRIGQGDSLYEKKAVSYLLGISRGKLCFAAVGTGMYEINVSLKNFPQGIASFYLFDTQKRNVSKRHVFVEKKDVNLVVSTGKSNFAVREQVKLDIGVTDPEGNPLRAMLSIAVTNDKYVKWPSTYADINSYLVDRAVSGIDYVDTTLAENIAPEKRDLLMLITDKLYEETSAEPSLTGDSGIVIRGKIMNKKNEPAGGFVATIFAHQHGAILADTADVMGKYDYPPMIFYDDTPFMTQVTDQKGAKQESFITTDPLLQPKLPELTEPTYVNADRDYQAALARYSRSGADTFLSGSIRQMLEKIAYESTTGQKQVVNKERRKGARVITGEQLDKFGLSNTANAVRLLPGVIMMNNRLTIHGGLQGMGTGLEDVEPLVVVDGVPSNPNSVVDFLNSLAPNSIDQIEVLAGPDAAQYGTRGGNGVILIKMANNLRPLSKGNLQGMSYIYPRGYHLAEEFYFPPYNIYEVRWAEFNDDRSTIYWNGEVITDSAGRALVNFYTGDLPATYTITVTGITSKGDLIHHAMKIDRN
jgi:TonB-dependent Receptor Plug Domain